MERTAEQELNFFSSEVISSSGRGHNILGRTNLGKQAICSRLQQGKSPGDGWSPAKAQNEGFGRVDAGEGGPCCVSQGRDEPESFLKLIYQRMPAGSWADTTRKGLETISRN